MGNCRDQLLKCIICASPYKVEEHRCGFIGYNKRKRKIYIYITVKCANYEEIHAANSPHCVLRYKANIKTRKEKKIKEKRDEKKLQVYSVNDKIEDEKREKSPLADTKIDLEDKRLAQSSGEKTAEIYIDEIQNYTKKY